MDDSITSLGLSDTLIGITLCYQLIYRMKFWAGKTIIGEESRETYLMQIVRDYPVVEFAKTYLPDEERVLLLGDGRGYYCVPICIPDPDHFYWTGQITTSESYSELGDWYSELQAKYLALSWDDIDFLLQDDPQGMMAQTFVRLSIWSDEGCLEGN